LAGCRGASASHRWLTLRPGLWQQKNFLAFDSLYPERTFFKLPRSSKIKNYFFGKRSALIEAREGKDMSNIEQFKVIPDDESCERCGVRLYGFAYRVPRIAGLHCSVACIETHLFSGVTDRHGEMAGHCRWCGAEMVKTYTGIDSRLCSEDCSENYFARVSPRTGDGSAALGTGVRLAGWLLAGETSEGLGLVHRKYQTQLERDDARREQAKARVQRYRKVKTPITPKFAPAASNEINQIQALHSGFDGNTPPPGFGALQSVPSAAAPIS
jgi:hypothetical protein